MITNSWTFIFNHQKQLQARCHSQTLILCRIHVEISYLTSSMRKSILRLKHALTTKTIQNKIKLFKDPTHRQSTARSTTELKRTDNSTPIQTLLQTRSFKSKISIQVKPQIQRILISTLRDLVKSWDTYLMTLSVM